MAKKMIIIVSGLPGSGKSTLVEKIAKEFNLKAVFASGILKQIMEKTHTDFESAEKGSGYWESRRGKALTQKREKELEYDKRLDEELLRIARTEKNVVFDSRTMPWLYKKGFKIWLDASETVRAERIAKRDNIEKEEVLKSMRKRYEADKRIYKKLYGFDLGKDFSPFHLIINSDELSIEEVFNIAKLAIRHYFEK